MRDVINFHPYTIFKNYKRLEREFEAFWVPSFQVQSLLNRIYLLKKGVNVSSMHLYWIRCF